MDTGFKLNKKIVIIVFLCLCIVTSAVGGVVAYLTSRTEPVTNEFVPAKVSCVVEEVFENGVKNDVKIRNTGNVDAYIRVSVVANFVSDDGKVLATAPQEGTDYRVIWSPYGWQKGTDGYWYHQKAIAPDDLTSMLIESASVISAPEGYHLDIQIIASAIQSEPYSAVQEAWGITPVNGELIPN
jgi:hypothetical protein